MVIFKEKKMKPILYLSIIVMVSLASCDIDNYESPQVTLTGKIVDAQTNELVESSGINDGTVIKIYEGNSAQPLILNTMPDGTFINSKFFAGDYSYIAEGPFTMAEEGLQNLAVKENSEIDIKVVPNIRMDISLEEMGGNDVKVTLTYEKLAEEQNLVNLALVWSEYKNPNVYTFSGGSILQEDVSGLNLTSGEQSFVIENLKPNTTYYIRGGGNTSNAGNYYNYSTQLEFQAQ